MFCEVVSYLFFFLFVLARACVLAFVCEREKRERMCVSVFKNYLILLLLFNLRQRKLQLLPSTLALYFKTFNYCKLRNSSPGNPLTSNRY